MIKAWTEEAWEDFEYWTTQDRKVLKHILQLLKTLTETVMKASASPSASAETCPAIGAAVSTMQTVSFTELMGM